MITAAEKEEIQNFYYKVRKKLNEDDKFTDREIIVWLQGYMEERYGWINSL